MSREIYSLARYRFRRANAAYRDGVSLFRKGSYESALNRFYYAAFYSARALLALKRLDASKHSGVISLFGQHFVKNGLIDKETARALSRSYERRLDSDYEDFVKINLAETRQVQKEVKQFITVCERFFKGQVRSEK